MHSHSFHLYHQQSKLNRGTTTQFWEVLQPAGRRVPLYPKASAVIIIVLGLFIGICYVLFSIYYHNYLLLYYYNYEDLKAQFCWICCLQLLYLVVVVVVVDQMIIGCTASFV